MTAYYNENDPKAAAWLRELIRQGHIAQGEVDERSIEDVTPLDVVGYTQCHFFAGIGGWSYALRLADWPDTRRVWTGSCPCQPFSAAGKGGGFDDARHLWPAWHHLIGECKPPIIFGEQVASKDGLNWFDFVHADLEISNYAVGVADLCAAGVGAPHMRQRLYFVAESSGQRLERLGLHLQSRQSRFDQLEIGRCGEAGALADDDDNERHVRAGTRSPRRDEPENGGEHGDVADADGGNASAQRQQRSGQHGLIAQNGGVSPLEHAEGNGRQQRRSEPSERGAVGGCWQSAEFIPCTDGKARPIEPGSFPLAHGVSHRVGLLRGYGNAIVAPQAAEFIRAYLDV